MTFVSTAASPANAGKDFAIESLPLTDRPAGWHAAAFRISISGEERVVLSAVPLTDDVSPAEWPSQPWGFDDLRTDGRFVIADTTGVARPVRVGGTHALLLSPVQ
jgi:hypothetical protein